MKVAVICVRALGALAIAVSLAACGTTYSLPGVEDSAKQQAAIMFADAKAEPPRRLSSAATGEARFNRVSRRVKPIAQALCEQEVKASKPDFDCNVSLEIDRTMTERNAYFSYAKPGNKGPVIRFSLPILQDTQSDDEVAFILGHEYGHLIGQHIEKGQQQALAGALIMGAFTAYANAYSASYGGYYDQNAVEENMLLGAAVGQRAYSKTYELESDMLGTHIASAAGYDPVKGARFFARDEAARSTAGNLSFWGTHPADSERIAMVIATKAQIAERKALERRVSN